VADPGSIEDEVRALDQDDADQAEMLAVASLMASLRTEDVSPWPPGEQGPPARPYG